MGADASLGEGSRKVGVPAGPGPGAGQVCAGVWGLGYVGRPWCVHAECFWEVEGWEWGPLRPSKCIGYLLTKLLFIISWFV